MRKVDFRAASVGSAALILSGVAVLASTAMFSGSAEAQLPTFGTVKILPTNSPSCGVGDPGKCSIIATDGLTFTQIQFELGGKTYIGTAIDETKNVTGSPTETFKAEDFVQVSLQGAQKAPTGIMSKSSIGAGPEFATSAEVIGGWALPAGVIPNNGPGSQVKIDLTVKNGAGSGLFDQKFVATVVFDETNKTNTTKGLSINQTVGLSQDPASGDKQRFFTQVADAAGTANIGGKSIPYTADGKSQIVWVGQTIGGVGQFGTTSLTTATTSGFQTSLTSSLPLTPWPSPGFGTAPTF